MKKQILMSIALFVVLSFCITGCSKNSSTVKTDEGEIVAGDSVDWPDDNMGDLSEPDATITAIVKDDTTGNCTVAFSEMSKDDATKYLTKLKDLGYQSIMEVNDTDGIMFSGQNAKGILVTFTYNYTAKEGTVSYVVDSDDYTDSGSGSQIIESSVDMTDVSPWPNGFITGVPELKGKISNVSNMNNVTSTVYLDYVEQSDFETYVATLKQNGYNVDANEYKDSSSYNYGAYNANGDYVNAYMDYESKTAEIVMEKAAVE